MATSENIAENLSKKGSGSNFPEESEDHKSIEDVKPTSSSLHTDLINCLREFCNNRLKCNHSIHLTGQIAFSIDSIDVGTYDVNEFIVGEQANNDDVSQKKISSETDRTKPDGTNAPVSGKSPVSHSPSDDKDERIYGAKRRKSKLSRKLIRDLEIVKPASTIPHGNQIKLEEWNNDEDFTPDLDDQDSWEEDAKEIIPKKGRKRLKYKKRTTSKKPIKKLKEYRCSKCDFVITNLRKLLAHQKAVHGQGGLPCSKCDKILSCKMTLDRHIKSVHELIKYKCPTCEREFNSPGSLYHHKRGEHGDTQPFKCNQCDRTFKFHHSLKLHKLKHSGVRPNKCQYCEKTYLTSTHLNEHIKVVHSEIRNYCCSVCGKRFGYANSLKVHEKIHTRMSKQYTCSVCGKGFFNVLGLKYHEGTHVESRDWKCDVCGKFYKTEFLLKSHQRRHTTPSSRFMCDICGNTFMYKCNLKMHAAVHSDTKDYTCSTCGKSFKTYYSLYSHLPIHNTLNLFPCLFCEKRFKTKSRLSAHQKRHSEQKKYECPMCKKLYSSKGDLGKHRKTIHGDGSGYSCPMCGKVSARCDNIRSHLKRVHGKDSQEYTTDMLKITSSPNQTSERIPAEVKSNHFQHPTTLDTGTPVNNYFKPVLPINFGYDSYMTNNHQNYTWPINTDH